MEGTYPIVSGAARIGALKVCRSGLMTVFDAVAERDSGLFRLSVYGGGREGYLGVMRPESDGSLRLRRSFTRAGLSSLPRRIEYAAASGEKPATPAPEPEAPPEPEPEPDALWYSSPDGTLSRYDGRRILVALPAEDVKLPAGAEGLMRVINGRSYVVFPW